MSEMIKMRNGMAGRHISAVCADAVALAGKMNKPVEFDFNDTHVIAQPGELPADVERRWDETREASYQAWIASPEHKQQQEDRAAKEKAEREAVMVDTSVTEKDMRESSVPWPKTAKQLNEYVASLVDRQHDYGSCVYAASMAAVAAFYYVSGQLGMTGFQASCADLDIIRRTRSIKGPFGIFKAEDALYPQYDLGERLDKMLAEAAPWLKEQAEKNLAESSYAHPDVLAHWKMLADPPTGGKREA